MKSHFILDKQFRQGSLYKIVEWNELNPYQKNILYGLEDENEIYGLFEPVNNASGLTHKVAYKEVAMLYLHLRDHDTLPHYFIVSANSNSTDIFTRLILDEIIQIDGGAGYVSGAAALPVIYGENIFEENTLQNFLTGQSYKAIYYAWMLNNCDLKSIAQKLYSFNTVPWDASMKSLFNEKHDARKFLFSQVSDDCLRMLNEYWQPDHGSKHWLSWSRPLSHQKHETAYTCKLYVSPQVKELPGVLAEFIPIIAASEAFSFKFGNSVQGLLRPDKMVAYFYSRQALLHTASILENQLENYAFQGVPFTTQLNTGMLSYGEDPPLAHVLDGVDGGSWRTFITDQIALAVIQAKKSKLNWKQTIGLIRAMLLTEGIDINNWLKVNSFVK